MEKRIGSKRKPNASNPCPLVDCKMLLQQQMKTFILIVIHPLLNINRGRSLRPYKYRLQPKRCYIIVVYTR